MTGTTGFWRAATVVAALALATPARADGDRVEVMAEVVLASVHGDEIDPPSLQAMKKKFADKTRYTSFKRLSLQKLTVVKAPPVTVQLPNRKVVSISLEELKDNAAKLKVSVPPLATTYTLGREGSLYQAAGKHSGGDLWLVLSAVEGAKATP